MLIMGFSEEHGRPDDFHAKKREERPLEQAPGPKADTRLSAKGGSKLASGHEDEEARAWYRGTTEKDSALGGASGVGAHA